MREARRNEGLDLSKENREQENFMKPLHLRKVRIRAEEREKRNERFAASPYLFPKNKLITFSSFSLTSLFERCLILRHCHVSIQTRIIILPFLSPFPENIPNTFTYILILTKNIPFLFLSLFDHRE